MPPRRRAAPASSSSEGSSSDGAAGARDRGGSDADSEDSNERKSPQKMPRTKGLVDKRKSPSKFAVLPDIGSTTPSPRKTNAVGRAGKARAASRAKGGGNGSSSDSSSSDEDDAPRKKAVPRRKPNPAPKKKQRAPPAKRKKPPAKKSVASADTGNSESSSSSSDDDAPRKKPIPRRNNGKQPAKAIAKGRSPGKSKEQTADADASTADSAKTESAKEDEFLLSEDPEKNREALVQSLDNRGVIANRTKSAGKAKDGVGAADKGMSLTKRQTRIITEAFEKCDIDKDNTVDRNELRDIMVAVGLKPKSQHEMNGLFQVTDVDQDNRCSLEEVMNMMRPRVGMRGDPGIVLDMGHLAVGKSVNKKDIKQPQIHLQLGTKMRPVICRAKPVSKDKKKQHGKPKHKLSKTSIVFEFAYVHFFETPIPCEQELYIEVVNGGPRNFGMDGRLEKTILAVTTISLADVEDDPTTKHLTLYKPIPKAMPTEDFNDRGGSAKSVQPALADENPRAEPSDDIFGHLDIMLDFDIQEAEEDLDMPDGENDDDAFEAQLDVHAALYNEAEKDIRKLIGKQSESSHHQAVPPKNAACDTMWKTLDPNSIGVASLGRVDCLISEKFGVLANTITLYYAYQFMQSGGHATIGASSLSTKAASRRSWVTYQDFLPLICNAFYFKRFWEVYERYLMHATGKGATQTKTPGRAGEVQYTADATCGIDTKEFFFIMRRCGLRLSDVELNGMFDSCGATDSGKILLASACNVVMTKTFFPYRSEVKLNQGKESEKTYAAKLKKKREEKAKGAKKPHRRGSKK